MVEDLAMSGPVEYLLPSGGRMMVERKGVGAGRGLGVASMGGGVVEKADQTFKDALTSIRDVSEGLLASLTDLATAPEKVEVEFGIDLAIKAGVIVTSGSVDANFKVKLTWAKKG
jgi:hypothetical protein